LSPRKITLVRRLDGSIGAQLIDPTAFRCSRGGVRGRRLSARRFVERRLHGIEQILEIVKKSEA